MKKIMLAVFFIVLLCFGGTYAATKQDVISAMNRSYEVGGKEYRLPDKFAVKIQAFLDKKELSSEQYSKLLSYIQRVVSLAQKAGTIDVNEMSKEEIKEGVSILYEASETVDIDLEKELKENNITIPKGKDTSTKTQNTSKEANVSKEPPVEVIEKSSGEVDSDSLIVEQDIPAETVPVEAVEEEPEDVYTFEELDDMFHFLMRIVITVFVVIQFLLFLIILLLFRIKRHKIIKKVLIFIFGLLFIINLMALIGVIVMQAKIKKWFLLYYFFR